MQSTEHLHAQQCVLSVLLLLLLRCCQQGDGLPAAAPRLQPGDHWTLHGELLQLMAAFTKSYCIACQ
jgi:hypothetical protein